MADERQSWRPIALAAVIGTGGGGSVMGIWMLQRLDEVQQTTHAIIELRGEVKRIDEQLRRMQRQLEQLLNERRRGEAYKGPMAAGDGAR